MRDKDSIILENLYNEMATYHASNKNINIDTINFNTPSLGFHVGTIGQAEFITKNKRNENNRYIFKTMNEFPDVLSRSLDNKLRLVNFEHDGAWEFPDMILLQLLDAFFIEEEQAIALVNKWKDDDESNFPEDELDHNENFYSQHEMLLRNFIKKGSPYKNYDYNEGESYDYYRQLDNDPYWYRDTDKLTDIRNLLLSNGIGAIEYKNEVEQNYEKANENSIVVFDKRMFEPKDQENTQIDPYVKFLNLARKNGYKILDDEIIIDGVRFFYIKDNNILSDFTIGQTSKNGIENALMKFINIIDQSGITIKIDNMDSFYHDISIKPVDVSSIKPYTKDQVLKIIRSNGFDNTLTRNPRNL